MLNEITRPEKEVRVTHADELQEILETEFKTTYHATTSERIRFLPNGVVQFDGKEVPCTLGFLESLSQSIDMPFGYACRIDGELFAINFEHRKESECRALTICLNRGIAVNAAPAEYRAVRTVEVLAGVIDKPLWNFAGARVSDRGVDIDFLQPGIDVAPEPGDIIKVGVRLTNSETGFGCLKGSRFSLRLVCTNGAVMKDTLGTARWNYDRRMHHQTSVEKFQKDLFKLGENHEAHVQLYEQLSQRIFLDREIVNVWRQVRGVLTTPDAVDRVLGLEAEDRQNLQAVVRARSPFLPPEITAHRVWDIHNRITAAAQRMSFARRSHLERIGGALLWDLSSN